MSVSFDKMPIDGALVDVLDIELHNIPQDASGYQFQV